MGSQAAQIPPLPPHQIHQIQQQQQQQQQQQIGGSGGAFTTVLLVGEQRIGAVRLSPRQPHAAPRQPHGDGDGGAAAMDGPPAATWQMFSREMRAARLTPGSNRSPPLAVLQTVASTSGPCFTLVEGDLPDSPQDSSQDANNTIHNNNINIINNNINNNNNNINSDYNSSNNEFRMLHATCLEEAKTLVVPLPDRVSEVHLVAMPSSGFWGMVSRRGVYESCLRMLNLRCLAMVLDLDETLILANSVTSFELRIEALRTKMRRSDAAKVPAIVAEIERFQADMAMLRQFSESDYVVLDNGSVVHAQLEDRRPVLRIPERNLIFTRIRPTIRYTSIVVKLRPGWDELRSHILAAGRKRFEVFICTMSERDYACEMWRLLDPDGSLIDPELLQERLLCVNAGAKKSLANMFQHGNCHPCMAMVIDDRPDVWEVRDQQNVYAVPPYSPFAAPQAEEFAPLQPLCIARNVASTVRNSFFKNYDEAFLQKVQELDVDTDASTLPIPPHVATYLSEVPASVFPTQTGLIGLEKEAKLNEAAYADNSNSNSSVLPPPALKIPSKDFPDGMTGPETRTALELQPAIDAHPPGFGQMRTADLQPTSSAGGGWLEDEDENGDSPPSSGHSGSVLQSEGNRDVENRWLAHQNYPQTDNGEACTTGKPAAPWGPIQNLQELGEKRNAMVDYRIMVCATIELQFISEAIFDGNKVGRGLGRTSKEAKQRAAEDALKYLESGHNWRSHSRPSSLHGRPPPLRYAGRHWNPRNGPGFQNVAVDDSPVASTSGKQEEGGPTPSFNAVAALKTLCTIQGLEVNYLERPSGTGTYDCEVDVGGRILGKGVADDSETAKRQAAEQALRQLNQGPGPGSGSGTAANNNNSSGVVHNNHHKRSTPHRTPGTFHSKRPKGDAWRPPTPSLGRGRDRQKHQHQWGRGHFHRR